MCHSTISWKDCFNKGRVGNCNSDKAVCSNIFTAEKQKDDQQKLQFAAACLSKVGWRFDWLCVILSHLVGLAHAHYGVNDFGKFFINFSKAVKGVCEYLSGIITILPFPMCLFFLIPSFLVIINPCAEAELGEGSRGHSSQIFLSLSKCVSKNFRVFSIKVWTSCSKNFGILLTKKCDE